MMKKLIFILLTLPTIISAQSYDPYFTNAEYDIYEEMCPNMFYEKVIPYTINAFLFLHTIITG